MQIQLIPKLGRWEKVGGAGFQPALKRRQGAGATGSPGGLTCRQISTISIPVTFQSLLTKD
jgi:hypothetical protein